MDNYFNYTVTEFSSAIIVFNLLFAFVLGIAIAWTYMKTHRGLSYSQSLVFTLVIINILGAVVMMVVRNNIIGAFALLGAFSLIRFRTILKETKDVTFVFYSLAVGVAVGTNNYMIAVLTTIILSAIIFLLTKYNFGSVTKSGSLMTFVARADFSADDYKNFFENYLESYSLLQIKSLTDNSREYSFAIKVKKQKSTDEFIKEFQALSEIENVDLVTSRSATEY